MNAVESFAHVRSDPRLTAVVVTPGADAGPLLDALAAVGAEAGLRVIREPAIPPEAVAQPTLYLCAHALQLRARLPGQSAVLLGDLDSAAAAGAAVAAGGKPGSLREGAAYAAGCLAHAQEFKLRSGVPSRFAAELTADPAEFVAFCRGLRLEAPADRVAAIGAGLVASCAAREAPARPDGEIEALNRILAVYRGGLTGSSGPAWWDRGLFWLGDAANQPCPEVIDTTGRRRNLFFGPGLALGPGLWRATAVIELCEEAALSPYRCQFGPTANMADEHLNPAGPGIYEITIDHHWARAGPVEFRLYLTRPSFHGEVRLAGVQFERLADHASAADRPQSTVSGAAS